MLTGAEDDSSKQRRLTGAELDEATGVLARAFYGYPMFQFIFPDSERQKRLLPAFYRATLRYTLLFGEVWAAPGLEGVACWLPPTHTEITIGRMLRAGMWRLPFRWRWGELRRNLSNLDYVDRLHARYAPGPHWYLFAIGIDPASQGRGIGSRLLRHRLARVDAGHLPVYLETHTPRNVTLYERHGFAVVSADNLPGSTLRVYIMLRPGR